MNNMEALEQIIYRERRIINEEKNLFGIGVIKSLKFSAVIFE